MWEIDTNLHHEKLDRIIKDHPELHTSSGLWLHLRVSRGHKKPDGTWEHEYYLEALNPFEQDEPEED